MDPLARVAAALRDSETETLHNEPMQQHTTFRIGGAAALFCLPRTVQQLSAALGAARQNHIPHIILGRGSNVLFGDAGYPGLVVSTKHLNTLHIENTGIIAAAGTELSAVCNAARNAGLSGLEFACGIPGSVGGAVFMNAGAFDGEVADVLESVCYLDENLEIHEAGVQQAQLGYRCSIFQQKPWCILEARFKLQKDEKSAIDARMKEIVALRRKKQPLEYPSAGSAFKRPKGAFAAALIDQCGLRGYRVGNAAVSEKHCGFIVNLGGASCSDVLALAEHITSTVEKQTGCHLDKEFRVVGG